MRAIEMGIGEEGIFPFAVVMGNKQLGIGTGNVSFTVVTGTNNFQVRLASLFQ